MNPFVNSYYKFTPNPQYMETVQYKVITLYYGKNRKEMSNSTKESANPKLQEKLTISKIRYTKVLKHPTNVSTTDQRKVGH